MRREFCCSFTGGQHRGYSIKDLVCTIVYIFQVPFAFNILVLFCVNLHTKCVINHTQLKQRVSILTTPKTIHCVSLIVSVIKYEHKRCVFGHTNISLLCQHVVSMLIITVVPEIVWKVTNQANLHLEPYDNQIYYVNIDGLYIISVKFLSLRCTDKGIAMLR